MQTAAAVAAPPEQRWLTCRLDKGMFSDEMAVTYPPCGDAQASVFVPGDAVRGEPGGDGAVRVQVFSRDGQTFAVLPTPDREVVAVAGDDTCPA